LPAIVSHSAQPRATAPPAIISKTRSSRGSTATAGFLPSLLTTGTRDLFLSNTVRVHRKMRAAGVAADLVVFEAQSHPQCAADPWEPDTKEHFEEPARFFEKHLAR
jgi:acetyl esterase/lipase